MSAVLEVACPVKACRAPAGVECDGPWPHTARTLVARATRACAFGCGLVAAAGDIYCDGCRSAVSFR